MLTILLIDLASVYLLFVKKVCLISCMQVQRNYLFMYNLVDLEPHADGNPFMRVKYC